ncbi:hypoxanthine-guanine phosphoribosyltransferase [Dehalogenimonas sp. WBC-2]|nr:hypoxanthine-guanine phosphoribosyltransferase [Dehalogenimonas sp. WBC-2]
MTSRFILKTLYPRNEITAKVRLLAKHISVDYQGKDLLAIGILNGATIFMADLVREMTIPIEFDFIRLESYGDDVTTCGDVKITTYPTVEITNRHILIVEDIVDTGLCVEAALKYLTSRKPASLKLCSLLDKPARRRVSVGIDYRGFIVPDKFIVGYGLDYAQHYRNLPDIYTLEEKDVD